MNHFPKIVIDPGHGAHDWGLRTGRTYNKGYDGCLEKDINMEVSSRLAFFCSKHNFPYILTRYGDRYVSLTERCFRANTTASPLFISVHCNYAKDKKIKGLETWHYRGSYTGRRWASKIQFLLDKVEFTRNRGVKGGRFYVLKHTSMAAILIELGFLSNKEDCKFLNNENNQDAIAHTIFEGIRTI